MAENTLSLNPGEFNNISEEDKTNLTGIEITFRTGTAQKPQKKDRRLPISLKAMYEFGKEICDGCLSSMEAFYQWLYEDKETKSKVILFARIDNGSGLVTSHEHFAYYVANEVRDFLYVYINQDNLDRCLHPSPILPEPLASFLKNSHLGESTVEDLMRAKEEEDRKLAIDIGRRSSELPIEGVPSSDDEPSEDDILSIENVVIEIPVWKKYATFLSALNSVMFTIDTHFASLGRTKSLDQDLIKNIIYQILEQHSQEQHDE